MPDPLLHIHQIKPLYFSIVGPMWPGNIRDQMLRAYHLVDRIVHQGLVSSGPAEEEKGLCVIGAGPSGMTAALRALEYGVRTTVADQRGAHPIVPPSKLSGSPFHKQRGCSHRWLSPNLYDWPHPHWHARGFPSSPRPPLAYRSDYANHIVRQWEATLTGRRPWIPKGHFTEHLGHKCTKFILHRRKKRISVELNPRLPGASSARIGPFGAILDCGGFPAEAAFIGSYSWFGFWEPDDLNTPGYGSAVPVSNLKILISGGGDGGLQDFLRILTDTPAPGPLFRSLESTLPPASLARIMTRLQAAEEQATRALAWGDSVLMGGGYDCSVLEQVEREHQLAVEQLVVLHLPALRRWLRSHLRNPLPSVDLLHSCNHFGIGYGLNRFMALLILRLLHTEGLAHIRRLPNYRLASVTGATSHGCGDPSLCRDHLHVVEVEPGTCRTAPTGSTSTLPDRYHIVVVRHGPKGLPPKEDETGQRVSHARLPFPYFLTY